MAQLLALRYGLLLAGVVYNEVNRHRRFRRQRRKRSSSKYDDDDDLYSGYGSEDEHYSPADSYTYPHDHRHRSYPALALAPSKRLKDQGIWLLDTGASQHACSDRRLFKTYTPIFAYAKGIGKEVLTVLGTGTVHLNVIVDGFPRILVLEDVAYIPDQQCEHLLAFDPFLRNGGRLWTEGWTTYVADGKGEVLLQCARVNSACQILLDPDPQRTKMLLQQMRERERAKMTVPQGW